MKIFAFCAGLALAISLASLSRNAQAQTSPLPPLNDPLYIRLMAQTSPTQAEVVEGASVKHSAYELYIANYGGTPMKIAEVTISGKHRGKLTLEEHHAGEDLKNMFKLASGKTEQESQAILEPGASAAIFLFPALTSDRPTPDRFETAIKVEGQGDHGGSGTIHVAPIMVDRAPPVVITSPVDGPDWQAANGPSNTSAHRRALLFVNGRGRIGQRYAIDWVQLGNNGLTYRGDEHRNASYFAYDHEIRAVADGTIVDVKDGIPENTPNSDKTAVQITYDTLAGNRIVEDLGGGRFAAYAHLRPGTITVKRGSHVHAGQIIGRLGNTGNSSEPHLHFQICDAPSFVDSEGLPFAIDRFTRQSYRISTDTAGKQHLTTGSGVQISNQEPMENELDNFRR
ncbi:MAG: M23 family metallopeptidase [Candidatus Binataceae bacterium]|nr:M23 family metallopeptidase [Candidatus Binataceae bacterium]